MTPFSQPAAAYTLPPSPATASILPRSDRFLASMHPPTPPPARNNGHDKHSSSSTSSTVATTASIPSISTTTTATTTPTQRFALSNTQSTTPITTSTSITDVCRDQRLSNDNNEKEEWPSQKQKQRQQTQDLCQEQQGPCTFLPSFSSTLSRTPSSTSTRMPTPTSTQTPDSCIYSTYSSRPIHMHNPHLSRPPPTQQQQLQRQHSLSYMHKKDASHYYTSHQQHLQRYHLPYAPSAHQSQQQHPSLVSPQREPSLGSYSSSKQGQVGSSQPNIGLVRSPDPRYLEAFEGYFGDHSLSSPQPPPAVAVMGIQSGEETASEDVDDGEDGEEEEEPTVRWAFSYKPVRDGLRRDRRRSRSVSGAVSPPASPTSSPAWTFPPSCDPYDGLTTPLSRTSSFLVSPATDGTVTTPPPSSRVSYSPRRRRHSCVAPNTKEFETLATIFGWVTDASANYPWPIRSEEEDQDQEEEEGRGSSIERIIMEGAPRYLPGSQSTVCESDDDSDLDDCFRQSSSSASWCTSRESRCSELSQTRAEGRFEHNPHSSNGSIEFLNESGEAVATGDTATSWSSSSKSSSRNKWQTKTPGSESASSSSSSSTPTPPQLHSMDDFQQNVHRCPITVYHQHQHQHHSLLVQSSEALTNELLSSNLLPRAASGLHRSDTMSTRHSYESLPSPLDSEQLESPMTQCSNSILMSPLSSSHGKDSGYTSFSYNKHGQPFESFATGVTQRLSEQRYSRAEDALNKTVQAVGAFDSNAISEDTEGPPAPPPIPPKYPEIDLRVFDHPEEESSETIVYAPPLEGSKRESLSGTLELRPIIAATIVKLIEKLTHQYGLDSGFMADFFLTYRLFMSPVQLCKYLIQRYLWALEEDTEFRCVIRVRTFVVFRFWINNHFADDFLTSKSLRFQMASFLNEMRFNTRVQASPRDSRIIRNLMDFFKYQRRYYKGLAQQSATTEMEQYHQQHNYSDRKDSGQVSENGDIRKVSTDGMTEPTAAAVAGSSSDVVDRLRVSIVHRQVDPVTGKVTISDVTETANAPNNPAKGRHRSYTLGGLTIKPLSGDAPCKHAHTKPPLSKEQPRTAQQMGRQASESSGLFQTRERRLSSSSIKSNRSTSTWSTKFVNKIRQKSEDFYLQIVHPSGTTHKTDSKQCVCWTLAYIGISEQHHHTLSSARSFPNLRPSVISTHYQQQEDTAGSGVTSNTSSSIPSLPSNKSIKRLKSSLSLGLHSSTSSMTPSPIPSPTRNQSLGISSRHLRSNSNSSVGYHPNPECPYHIPCVEAIQTDSINAPPPPSSGSSESGASSIFTTLKEALQEDYTSTTNGSESGSSSQPQSGGIVPPSPAWNYGPWHSSAHQLFPTAVPPPPYKPFILFYRSQLIAQQLCLLEQHFLENVKWDELLEVELCRAGRKSRSKVQSSISGYFFKTEGEPNGMDASNERSNMLCMWVASEVVSTRVLDDRVRVIEKFIRIAQKCYQYRNFNSLMQLVMGLGSSPLCGLRRTWARVGSYEMRVLQDLQDFISPFGNWSDIRKAMNQVGYQETFATAGSSAGERKGHQRLSVQGSDVFSSSIHATGQDANGTSSTIHSQTEPGHSKYLQYQAPLDRQGCIPFLGLFVFDLTHIAVSPSWFLPQAASSSYSSSFSSLMNGPVSEENNGTSVENGMGSVPPTPMKANHMATAAWLEAPESKDLQDLLPSGTLLVHFYRYQLIAKTIKWFMAFQQRSPKYTFSVDSTLYSKCFLLRVLTKERVKELAIKCESE